ncbi:Uncharacterised protein [Neisseria gonorrhoeae]|uniref:Uncharacterized protein n=1 Tax=Neisseria gonorrhoeae TaxID=485 RepID=A0A1D3HFJ8_NEIGO|nr:hypothetical protein VT05_01535 [Neisseria gonorrhoeae]EQS72823.1 hypothetical protein NGEG_04524 [Neisseria gonorrhoeae FA19]AKP13190.1 hypothetical protein WX60_01298 [Neisseria gonorrhoeae]AKP14863.1 hypothetical protein WX61_00796 [Neisseria gonorrhoeae]KAE9499727.1 putative identified by MetaGeneAnnotator domain protein [Neisseria gonorrhoeae]
MCFFATVFFNSGNLAGSVLLQSDVIDAIYVSGIGT